MIQEIQIINKSKTVRDWEKCNLTDEGQSPGWEEVHSVTFISRKGKKERMNVNPRKCLPWLEVEGSVYPLHDHCFNVSVSFFRASIAFHSKAGSE